MRARLVSALVLAACTSAEPRPEPVTVHTPLFPAPEITANPAPVISAAHWHWDDGPVVDATPLDPNGARIVGDSPLRLQLRKGGAVVVDREVPGSEHHDVGVVKLVDGMLYVAHHSSIASGATLARFSATDGELLWSTELRALGPIDHDQYRNQVQLAVENGNPVVFGNEAGGKYTEIVDAHSGKTLAHGVPLATLADAEWMFVRPGGSAVDLGVFGIEWDDIAKGPWTLPTEDGSFVFTEAETNEGRASVERLSSDGGRMWKLDLPGDSHCGRVAMQELADRLWIVRWCAIATGADLLAIDPSNGSIRASRALRALPDIGHSEYLNAVQWRVVEGHPVVMGNEAGGHYFEAIDPANGLTVVSRTWK